MNDSRRSHRPPAQGTSLRHPPEFADAAFAPRSVSRPPRFAGSKPVRIRPRTERRAQSERRFHHRVAHRQNPGTRIASLTLPRRSPHHRIVTSRAPGALSPSPRRRGAAEHESCSWRCTSEGPSRASAWTRSLSAITGCRPVDHRRLAEVLTTPAGNSDVESAARSVLARAASAPTTRPRPRTTPRISGRWEVGRSYAVRPLRTPGRGTPGARHRATLRPASTWPMTTPVPLLPAASTSGHSDHSTFHCSPVFSISRATAGTLPTHSRQRLHLLGGSW